MVSKKIVVYSIAFTVLASLIAVVFYWDYQIHQTDREEETNEHAHHDHDHHHPEKNQVEQAAQSSLSELEEKEEFISLTEEQTHSLGIETQSAQSQQLAIMLTARGKIILHPDRVAHVLPNFNGTVRQARKNVGDLVTEGEILAILESKEMAEAKAEYLGAVSQEQAAWTILNREKKLYDKKITSEQDYLSAKTSHEDSSIRLLAALQKLYTLGIDNDEISTLSLQSPSHLRLYEIKSPLEGEILSRHLTKGERVDSSTTIYEIADLKTVWIELGIYPHDLAKIKEGQSIEVILPVENKKSEAKIIYISPLIEDENIMAKAIAELDNRQKKWCPGSLVNVNIRVDLIPVALAIPHEALQIIDGEDYVFTKTAQGFIKKQVQLGRKDHNYTEIIAGLEPGEVYASKKTFLLKAEFKKNDIEDDDH